MNSTTELLKLEENGNTEDKWGMTPVCRAINKGDKDLVLAYIKQGLDMNYQNSVNGVTPFISACNSENLEMVNFLIDHVNNLNVNLEDRRGNTALYYSCQYGYNELVHLILRRTKPHVNLTMIEKGLPVLKESVVKELIDTYRIKHSFIGDLIEILQTGPASVELQKYVLGGSMDPNDPDYYTDSMFLSMCKSNSNEDILTQLLTKNDRFKSRINDIVDSNGQTALIIAVNNQAVQIVKLFLEHGASPNIKDNIGNNAINYAMNSYDDGADYLRLRDPPEALAEIFKLLKIQINT